LGNNHWEKIIAEDVKKHGNKKGLILAGGGHGLFPDYGNIAGAPVVLFSDPKYAEANKLVKKMGISSDFEVTDYDGL
jgi:hypothetical protein